MYPLEVPPAPLPPPPINWLRLPVPPEPPRRARGRSRVLTAIGLYVSLALVAAVMGAATPERPADRPDRPLFGRSYAFLGTSDDGKPFRWDPCSPIRYEVDLGPTSHEALSDIREAVRRTSQASGLQFEFGGVVEDASVDDLIGDSFVRQELGVGTVWSPVLIAFVSRREMGSLGARHALGGAIPVTSRHDADQFVSGVILLNVDAEMDAGFDHPESLGSVVQHELGHIVGLDHVWDPFQLMSRIPISPRWGFGDLEGLRLLGDGPCLEVPDASLFAAIVPWADD